MHDISPIRESAVFNLLFPHDRHIWIAQHGLDKW